MSAQQDIEIEAEYRRVEGELLQRWPETKIEPTRDRI
jgi:hypothetical protein